MNFRIKEKLMLWISGSKKNLFQRNKLAQRWSFHSIYEAWAAHEMRKGVVQLYIKNNEVIFSLAWNIIFSDNLKVLVLKFLEMKDMVFLSQKVDGNMIFTDYWKVLVLIFSGMGNTVFFWAKKLMERWYLLGLFELSMIFQDLGNMVFRAATVSNHFNFYVLFRWYF